MFEELPELETKDFIRKTCESIGWYWTHDSDADEILWFVEEMRPRFKDIDKRKFIERTIHEFGIHGHQETHSIIVYLQQKRVEEPHFKIADQYFHFVEAVCKQVPESKQNPEINFLWLYIEYIFSEVIKKHINN